MARAGARPPRLASDGELVARARSGCDEAFAELTRRHRATLVRACARVVGADLAEDAAQQALLKALVALRGDAEPPTEIRAWLLRVSRNESIDMVRRRSFEQGGGSEEIAPLGEGRSPHEVIEERRELRSVVREIGRLPERQRQALLLRAIEGHGYEQIAEALDVGDGVVRQLIYRARERVRAAAAALIAPAWLLRRGVPTAHALKASAVVATASIAVGGAVVIRHGSPTVKGGPDVAQAASPAVPPAPDKTQVVLGGPTKNRGAHKRPNPSASRARPHASRSKRAAPRAVAKRRSAQSPTQHRSAPAHGSTPAVLRGPTPSPPPPSAPPQHHPQPADPPHGRDPTPPPAPAPEPAPTPPSPSPPPAPPAGPAVPPSAGTIASYQQSPGFGGPLTIRRASGESVRAYFGELVVLTCYFVRDGHVVSHDTCTKERLTSGIQVARAEHGPNAQGYDVWTNVDLIVPGP